MTPNAAIVAWDALLLELDRWAAGGRTAAFWWRDDDAATKTPALDRLLALAGEAGVFPTLAVIPAAFDDSLGARLALAPRVAVVQHGWAHTNHAPAPARKCELGADRPAAAVLAELNAGRRRLHSRFGAGFFPVLVPPWNRIAPAVVAGLAAAGFTGLSTFTARGTAPPGLVQVNAHADPIAWRTGGGLDAAAALAAAVAHLAAKREGRADPGEPTGLLTHHLVQDDATWAFTARFIATTAGHPAGRWLDGAAVFGGG